jgi:ParB-like chromosome segregation protein Spo0J
MWKTIEVELDLVDPDPRNPNTMTDEVRSKLTKSLQRPYGQFDDIKIRDHPIHTGRYMLIGGHQRVAVMKELGWTVATAKYCGALEDHYALEIMINDNELRGEPDPIATALVVAELETIHTQLGDLEEYRSALAYTDMERENLLAVAASLDESSRFLDDVLHNDEDEEINSLPKLRTSAEVIVRFGFSSTTSARECVQKLWSLLYDFGEVASKPKSNSLKIPAEFLGDALHRLLKYLSS